MIVCKLAEILLEKGWSIYRLRKESGVSYPTLLGLCHKRSRMYRADVLEKLCRALNCQPGDILRSSRRIRGTSSRAKK
jgi:putative transcriptional regulator